MSKNYDYDTPTLSAEDLRKLGSKPTLRRDTSDSATTVESSTPYNSPGPSRSNTGEFYGKETATIGLSASPLEAAGLSASASGPDIVDDDDYNIKIDQLGIKTIPIFVEEIQKFLNMQSSENKAKSSSGKINETFIDQDKIDRLPQPIREFAGVVLLKFLIYNKYDFKIGGQKDYDSMSIYGDTITLKNIILTLIYNCLGDKVVDEMNQIDDSEWYEYIGALGYEPEQGKGGKKSKKSKNKTRKRGGMPPKKNKKGIFSALNFLGMVCTCLYDILIVVTIIVSLYYGIQMFIESYESLKPIRKDLIEPYKKSLTNTTYTDLLSESDKEFIAFDDKSLQYIGENRYDQYGMRNIIDVGTHAVLISLGSLAQFFGDSTELVHLRTLAALGLNDGSQKMDIIIREGMDNIFSACFYDITTTDAIKLARTTLRNLHIDQQSRDLIKRIIDGKEEEYNAHLSTMPPSPDKLAIDAAEAEVVVEATIPATEESVGFWSRTVNSVSGFVGTAKDTVVSAASKGKSAVNEFGTATVSKVHDLGVAIKVAATAFDRGTCMKTEFREIYDDNRRKYEDFMAIVRKQSNRVTTAISYSRTEAFTGWAIIGFSLYMLSYLRHRIKDQGIQARLVAVENVVQEDQLAIGNEQLAIGNEQEPAAQGQLAIGNEPGQGVPGAQGQGPVMLNPWNNPNLPVRRVGTPGRRQAQQGQLQIENANEEKEEGGGRRQTKKRMRKTKKIRRQTRKPKRITRKRGRM